MFTSAADAARKKAAADYDKSHNAFNETRDTPPQMDCMSEQHALA